MPYQCSALVRDKNGNPRFDSFDNISQGLWDLLTEAEQSAIINYRKTGVLSWL